MITNYNIEGAVYTLCQSKEGDRYSVDLMSDHDGEIKAEAILRTHDKAEAYAYYAYLAAKLEEAQDGGKACEK